MADAPWFFSTLAQVSATIVGFIVAFSAGLYPLERQRREDRTDRLRNALINFRNDYFKIIRSLSLIAHDGDVTTQGYLKDFGKDVEELREDIEEDTGQRGEDSPIIWAHLYRIQELLEKVDAENDFLLTSEELDILGDSIQWLYSYFNVANEDNQQFYYELSDLVNENQIPDGYYHDDVYDSGAGAVNSGNDVRIWITAESDGRHREWAGYSQNDSGISGKNLFSYATVLEYIHQDIEQVERRRSGTILNYEPRIKSIIWGVVGMTIIGVFVPSIFLLTPASGLEMLIIEGWNLLIAQWLLLLLSGIAFAFLLFQVMKSIETDVSVRNSR